MFTTIKIYSDDLSWWNSCLDKLELSSADAFRKFKDNVALHHHRELYASLKSPSNFKKPLDGVRLAKKVYEK